MHNLFVCLYIYLRKQMYTGPCPHHCTLPGQDYEKRGASVGNIPHTKRTENYFCGEEFMALMTKLTLTDPVMGY